MSGTYDELLQWKEFLDQGAITQEEFDAKKQEVLSRPLATSTEPVTATPQEYSEKSKIAAGLLAIFLGTLGIHKFYLGYTTQGIIMLVVSLLTFGIGACVMAIIALIEGIMYLTKSDADFYEIYVKGDKPWF